MRGLALFLVIGIGAASPAAACSLAPYQSPLRQPPEQIEETARQMIADPAISVVEATVLAPTLGHRSVGRLRVNRILRGTAPAEISVRRPFCGWGFPNVGERNILLLIPGREPRSFVHPGHAAIIRRLLAADEPLGTAADGS